MGCYPVLQDQTICYSYVAAPSSRCAGSFNCSSYSSSGCKPLCTEMQQALKWERHHLWAFILHCKRILNGLKNPWNWCKRNGCSSVKGHIVAPCVRKVSKAEETEALGLVCPGVRQQQVTAKEKAPFTSQALRKSCQVGCETASAGSSGVVLLIPIRGREITSICFLFCKSKMICERERKPEIHLGSQHLDAPAHLA